MSHFVSHIDIPSNAHNGNTYTYEGVDLPKFGFSNNCKPSQCCNQDPIFWKCECHQNSFCGCDVEKIECASCGRIVYGADDEDVERWNNGGGDE